MPILILALSSAESAPRKTPAIPLNKPVSDKLPPSAAYNYGFIILSQAKHFQYDHIVSQSS